MDGFEEAKQQEFERLQQQVRVLTQDRDKYERNWRDMLATCEAYAKDVEQARDQARVATRGRDDARKEFCSAADTMMAALKAMDADGTEPFMTAVTRVLSERDAAQQQCGEHQQGENELALELQRFRQALGFVMGGRAIATDGEYETLRGLCVAYDASIDTNAPPPVDWEGRAEKAESVIARAQKEFRQRDMDADNLPSAVACILEAHGGVRRLFQHERDKRKAAEAVVETARIAEQQGHDDECSAMDENWADGCTCYLEPLHDAIAAYDAVKA